MRYSCSRVGQSEADLSRESEKEERVHVACIGNSWHGSGAGSADRAGQGQLSEGLLQGGGCHGKGGSFLRSRRRRWHRALGGARHAIPVLTTSLERPRCRVPWVDPPCRALTVSPGFRNFRFCQCSVLSRISSNGAKCRQARSWCHLLSQWLIMRGRGRQQGTPEPGRRC